MGKKKKKGAKASSDFGACVFKMSFSEKNTGQRNKEVWGLGELPTKVEWESM